MVSTSPSKGEIAETIQRATIVNNGKLQSPHEWLLPSVERWRAQKSDSSVSSPGSVEPKELPKKKRVLLLGSGLVAGPAVEVFSARKDILLGIGQFFKNFYYYDHTS